MFRILGITLLLTAAIWAGKPKNAGPYKNENQSVAISATPILDREQIKEILGSDLDGHYILISVTVTPKFGNQVDIHRDDFLLKTDKDGERSAPFVASQIAGRGTLVVTQTAAGTSGGPMMGSPTWGYPGMGGGGFGGGGGSDVTEARAKMKSGSKETESPLLKVLNEKILPEKKSDAAVSGLLYFPLEKQKQKDLELIYTTPDGKLSLRFR